jgi:hypothetical protein
MVLALGQKAISPDQSQEQRWATLAFKSHTTLSQEAMNPVLRGTDGQLQGATTQNQHSGTARHEFLFTIFIPLVTSPSVARRARILGHLELEGDHYSVHHPINFFQSPLIPFKLFRLHA